MLNEPDRSLLLLFGKKSQVEEQTHKLIRLIAVFRVVCPLAFQIIYVKDLL